jgi:hypothetical protein
MPFAALHEPTPVRLCCNKLIQDLAGTRNNDSKEPALRFDSYKFPLHRARLATFATPRTKPDQRMGRVSSVAEGRRRQRLEYCLDAHAETQQIVVTAGQAIDLKPDRQTVTRKTRRHGESRRAECWKGNRIP